MALKLVKTRETGVVAEYWSISEINIKRDELHIRMDLHISQEIKESGKSAVESKRMIIPCTKEQAISGNIYQIAYEAIKETSSFFLSVDV